MKLFTLFCCGSQLPNDDNNINPHAGKHPESKASIHASDSSHKSLAGCASSTVVTGLRSATTDNSPRSSDEDEAKKTPRPHGDLVVSTHRRNSSREHQEVFGRLRGPLVRSKSSRDLHNASDTQKNSDSTSPASSDEFTWDVSRRPSDPQEAAAYDNEMQRVKVLEAQIRQRLEKLQQKGNTTPSPSPR